MFDNCRLDLRIYFQILRIKSVMVDFNFVIKFFITALSLVNNVILLSANCAFICFEFNAVSSVFILLFKLLISFTKGCFIFASSACCLCNNEFSFDNLIILLFDLAMMTFHRLTVLIVHLHFVIGSSHLETHQTPFEQLLFFLICVYS